MPAGMGRLHVRSISLSWSRSKYWFSAPAPPADKPVPNNVQISLIHDIAPSLPK